MTFNNFANLHIIKDKNLSRIKESIEDIRINLREYQRQNKNTGRLSEDTINRIHSTEDSDLKTLTSVCETIQYNIDQILLSEMKVKTK